MIRSLLLTATACLASVVAPHAGDPPALATELVAGGFDLPTYATAPAHDARVFVLEQNSGLVRVIKDGAVLAQPFLDLAGTAMGGGEGGLLCLAFHPLYRLNGRFFVTYTDLDDDLVLAEFQVDPANPDRALPDSGAILLELDKPFSQHNGSMIAFDPLDGMLVLSTGDGGAGNDPFNHAQDLGSRLGKLLRLDVDSGAPYVVPPDNPFLGVPGAAPEVYAYGLRNPWRFSFDRDTGDLWIGDVGQEEREEIDLLPARSGGGQNFGWRCMEGTLCTELGGCGCPLAPSVAPVHEYDHEEGCAVTGGYVYRGDAIPELQGRYFFADYCTSRVWSFEVPADGVGPVSVLEHTQELKPPGGSLGFVAAFGEDGDGELLVVGQLGDVRRVVLAPPAPDCDGDGVPDAEELASGAAFDTDGDGVPDSCQLLLDGSEVVKGQLATLDFLGAEPGQTLAWFATTRGLGMGPCFFNGVLCLDLNPFGMPSGPPGVLLLALTAADGMGTGQLAFTVPLVVPGMGNIGFQVVAVAGVDSVKSNPIQRQLMEP